MADGSAARPATGGRGMAAARHAAPPLSPPTPSSVEPPAIRLRDATLGDIDALLAIETASFIHDRISRRSFRHLLSRAHADTILAEIHGDGRPVIVGYAMVLYNAGTSLARLYSIATAPGWRGRGIGRRLLDEVEIRALAARAVSVRLEVRADAPAIAAIYEQAGYRRFGRYVAYYEDEVDAIRMEKPLVRRLDPARDRIPYVEQSLPFTCGPAALIMAMHALDPKRATGPEEELRIWRDATTIFMTSGHGGCSPHGLALAGARRGFRVALHISGQGTPFVDGVRSPAKKRVIEMVQAEFVREIAAEPRITLTDRPATLDEMRAAIAQGAVPLQLVSSWRFDRQKAPHWVVVIAIDDGFVHIHDPFVDREERRAPIDCMRIPVARRDFEHMSRYGRAALRATLLISAPATET